jgi:predicted outer membrane protein
MSRQLFGSLALAAMMASVATAQTAAPATPPQGAPSSAPVASPSGQAGQAGQLDQGIAACLYLTNQEEVAIAQFAEGRAEHAEVKKFVEMILKDHRDALQKLQRVSPQLASMNLQLTGAASGQAGAAGAQAGAPGTTPATTGQVVRPAGQAGGDLATSMVALQRRVAEECLSLTQKELSEKEGAEFDRCFIGQQLGAHLAALAKLRGSREFASPQLQQFIDEATTVVEHHIEQAKQIAKKLEGEHREDAAQARRDGSAARRQ